ncbi:MAG TPA: hypothetical protein VE645_18985 [Pseudonocardiaceae bacterium]|jgi:hypothetical protein|nr:hypothetical protein [Pseudonocardiaceae bacterium]
MSTASPDPQDIAADESDIMRDESGRQRGPATYDVYRRHDADAALWRLVAEGVEATSRRAAVVAAVKDPTADESFGQFLVVRSSEAKVLTREKKVIPETIADDWS